MTIGTNNDTQKRKPFDDKFPGLWDWLDKYDEAFHAKYQSLLTSSEFAADDYLRQLLSTEQQKQP